MKTYWKYSDDMEMKEITAELLKVTVPPSFVDLHESLLENLSSYRFSPDNIELKKLKNKYPWIDKFLTKKP